MNVAGLLLPDVEPPARETCTTVIEVEVNNPFAEVSSTQLEGAVRRVLAGEGVSVAEISLAVVADDTIHQLNRRYLDHDYPTDVLSFVLDQQAGRLEGEVIVSVETARRRCAEYGWSSADELLLYVVHGTLHLAGYDDQTPAQQQRMRTREVHYLAELGVAARSDEQPRLPAADGRGDD